MFGKKHSKPQGRIDSLIGAGTVITGDVNFTGGLRIDGIVRGNVIATENKGGTLVLSEAARVEGGRGSHPGDTRVGRPARPGALPRTAPTPQDVRGAYSRTTGSLPALTMPTPRGGARRGSRRKFILTGARGDVRWATGQRDGRGRS